MKASQPVADLNTKWAEFSPFGGIAGTTSPQKTLLLLIIDSFVDTLPSFFGSDFHDPV